MVPLTPAGHFPVKKNLVDLIAVRIIGVSVIARCPQGEGSLYGLFLTIPVSIHGYAEQNFHTER